MPGNKRFFLGKLSRTGDAESLMERATAFGSTFFEGTPVTRAVYSEAIAQGPRGDGFAFDFLLEAWLGDVDATFHADRSVVAARDAGIDPNLSRTVFAVEHVIKPGSAAVKGTFLSRRRPGSTIDEYLHYWRNQHAEIIQAQRDFFSFVRAYVQNHFVPGSFVTLSGQKLPQEESFDGSPQMWFDSADDVYKAFATDGYQRRIKADERILVKVGYSQSFISKEFPAEL